MERGWGDPEAKIWAKAWKLDCLGCSWGERELPKNRLRQRDYWNMERGWGDPEAKAKHGSLIASVIRGVSVSCRKPLGTEGLFVG